MRLRIAIVGGGWAGMAAGATLAGAGQAVTVYESARQLGGRARTVAWDKLQIDNGQHLMVGAYRETLDLINRLGMAAGLVQRPLELRLPGFHLRLPRLPAPMHLVLGLALAEGLTLTEKIAAARFMQALKRAGFQLGQDVSAVKLLARHRQPTRLIDSLWAPLCIAALNTPLESASGQVFCNVLRDSLAGPRAASDLVFNRTPMGALLPEAAATYLSSHGGQVRTNCKIAGIERRGRHFYLSGPDIEADHVVLAVHPARVPGLASALPAMTEPIEIIRQLTWEPILTLWLRFAEPVSFPCPMLGLGPGQSPWAFERDDIAPGVVSIVVSADGPHLTMPSEQFLDHSLALLAEQLGPLPRLLDWKGMTEKRATYACTPGLARPDNRTPVPGLYLAGDYTAGDYPATLEGAVRSGVKCAQLILDSL